MELFHSKGRQDKIPICHAQKRTQMRILSASPARRTTMSRQASAPPNWRMYPFVSAQLLGEILLLSNPSKTPALGKASVSKAAPSTAAFERSESAVACKTISPRSVPIPTKNIPPIPANPFTMGINGFIVFMIMPIYTQIRHLRKDGLHD